MKWNLALLFVLSLTVGCGQMYHPAPSSASSLNNPPSNQPGSAKVTPPSAKPVDGDGIESHSTDPTFGVDLTSFLYENLSEQMRARFHEVRDQVYPIRVPEDHEELFKKRVLARLSEMESQFMVQNFPSMWNEVIQKALEDIL